MAAAQTHDAEPARLIILGAANTGKRTLLEALHPTCGGDADLDPTLVLDNKYYTAQVQLVVCSTSRSSTPARIQGAHGLVVVIDGSRHASFTAAQQCLDACDTEAADVRLLVANKADLCHLSPSWHEDVRAWCIDNLFEFVLAAPGNAGADAALSAHGEEQQGMGRIRAALEATIWPGMALKPTSSSLTARAANRSAAETAIPEAGAPTSSSRDDQTTSTCSGDAATAHGARTTGLHPSEAPFSSVAAAAGGAGTAAAAAAAAAAGVGASSSSSRRVPPSQGPGPLPQVQGAEASSDDEEDAAAGGGDANPFLSSNAEGEWDEEDLPPADSEDAKMMASVQEFETVLAEIGRARDKAAALPDQERRAYAAAIAARFADMLGLQEDDTESDDQL